MSPKYNFDLPAPVSFVISRLHEAGYTAYVVGGCVRDFLMHRTPVDFDVTTSALPDETLAAFADCRVVETGLKHGTVTIVRDGMNIEVTTYRIDGKYLDNRHPENVQFTDKLSLDLMRRDFTINAMAYSPKDGIIDLHGGLSDIEKGVIRCVGCAEERFSEDGLRILRALRFSSVLGFTPDTECTAAAKKLKGLLSNISRERIYAELTKLVTGKNAGKILREYADIISFILPPLSEESVVDAASGMEKTALLMGSPVFELGKSDREALFYAILLGRSSRYREIFLSLKPSRAEEAALCKLIAFSAFPSAEEDFIFCVKRTLSAGGVEFSKKAALYAYAKGEISPEEAENIVRIGEKLASDGVCVSLSDLKIGGTELSALGLSGAEIGKTLSLLLEAVMREEIVNDPESLTEFVRKKIKNDR